MAALFQGHPKCAALLAQKGANQKIRNKSDQSIIHLAAKENKHKVLEKLKEDNVLGTATEKPGDKKTRIGIDDVDQFDQTPLHFACSRGHLETIKVLLKLEAAIEKKDEDERTPFLLAAENGHDEVVEFLLEEYENAEDTEKKKHLVNDTDEDKNSALHLAASKGMTRTLEVLLKFKADYRKKNNLGWTPLECAADAGSYNCVLKLLDAGAQVDPDPDSMNGLYVYEMSEDEDESESEDEEKNEDEDEDGDEDESVPDVPETALRLAAIGGHANVTKLLLDRGADVKSENKKKMNALELAIDHGNISVARVILESSKWEDAMASSSTRNKTEQNTPMRMLIRKFPSLAVQVLDKCITPPDDPEKKNKKKKGKGTKTKVNDSEEKKESKESRPQASGEDLKSQKGEPKEKTRKEDYTFNFTFLDDSYLEDKYKRSRKGGLLPWFRENTKDQDQNQKWDEQDVYSRYDSECSNFDENFETWEEEEREEDKRYPDEIIRNHPLMIISKQQQVLLKHPLCLALLSHKWRKLRWLFWIYNLFYLVYLILITTYVLMDHELLAGTQWIMDIIWYITFVFIVLGISMKLNNAYKVKHKSIFLSQQSFTKLFSPKITSISLLGLF